MIGDIQIEDLPIKFTAVAADIKQEKEVWLSSGSLFDAIRASISLPLFFTPHIINGVELIDGGTLNLIPVAPTSSDKEDMKISSELNENVSRLLTYIKESIAPISANRWSVYEIANQSFDAMQNTIARQKLIEYSPNVIVNIPRDACGTLEFNRAKEMINLGHTKIKKTYKKYFLILL